MESSFKSHAYLPEICLPRKTFTGVRSIQEITAYAGHVDLLKIMAAAI